MSATEVPLSTTTARARAMELVDGEVSPATHVLGDAHDPNTGDRVGDLCSTSEEMLDNAISVAQRGWGYGRGPWSALPLAERVRLLRCIAGEIDTRVDRLAHAHAADIGIPITVAALFASGLSGVVENVAQVAEQNLVPEPLDDDDRRVTLYRLPWGPAALFGSWNAPAFVAVTKLANALASGCPAVLKPSEYAGTSTDILVEAVRAAGLPPQAMQVVQGGAKVGMRLATDPRVKMLSYTGGNAGGEQVALAGSSRMAAMQLELSASNPAIVLPGGDIARTAHELARGAVLLNGQWCEAPRRVLVHAREHDELVDALLAELGALTVGHSLDPATELGPLAFGAHRERVARQTNRLAEHGQRQDALDDLPPQGFFFSPTVVSGLPLDAVREEIFGPVLAVQPFGELDDAVGAANALGDGLAGYVFGPSVADAHEVGVRLHAGEVRIGGTRVLDLVAESAQSFWGLSGVGGHGRAGVLLSHVGLRIVGTENPELAL